MRTIVRTSTKNRHDAARIVASRSVCDNGRMGNHDDARAVAAEERATQLAAEVRQIDLELADARADNRLLMAQLREAMAQLRWLHSWAKAEHGCPVCGAKGECLPACTIGSLLKRAVRIQ